MKKTILVLTNLNGRNKLLSPTELEIVSDEIDTSYENDELNIIVLDDEHELKTIKTEVGNKKIDYLAYHVTKLDNEYGLNEKDLKDEIFVNTFKKGFSHEPNYKYPKDFYNVILPKIYIKNYDELTLADIEKYFPSPLELSLSLLHDIYSGVPKSKFYKKDIYNDLIKEAKADKIIDSLDEDWYYSEQKSETLINLRDQLITFATQKNI